MAPQALDVRHAISTGAIWEPCNQTPGGLPIMCCRVRLAGVMPGSNIAGDASKARSRATPAVS
jgi:hypothetical protein